jgi:hypothetical protein
MLKWMLPEIPEGVLQIRFAGTVQDMATIIAKFVEQVTWA